MLWLIWYCGGFGFVVDLVIVTDLVERFYVYYI